MPSLSQTISKEDIRLIHDSFSQKSDAQIILKNTHGGMIKPMREIVNLKGYAIKCYMGRTLKHSKFFKKVGQPQVTVARAGMKYDDVPSSMRELVSWSDADFI